MEEAIIQEVMLATADGNIFSVDKLTAKHGDDGILNAHGDVRT